MEEITLKELTWNLRACHLLELYIDLDIKEFGHATNLRAATAEMYDWYMEGIAQIKALKDGLEVI